MVGEVEFDCAVGVASDVGTLGHDAIADVHAS